jgi:hypothetical protein
MAISIPRLAFVISLPTLAAVVPLACTSIAPSVSPFPLGADAVVAQYKDYQQMVPDHLELGIKIADCVGEEEMRKRAETKRTLGVRMNPAAMDAFTSNARVYPIGAVIVKEKLLGKNPTALGGMIKRAKGFDPDHGDWEFFYATLQQSANGPMMAVTRFDSGKLTHCVQCHNAVAEKDHVYGSWDWPRQQPTDYHNNNSIEK